MLRGPARSREGGCQKEGAKMEPPLGLLLNVTLWQTEAASAWHAVPCHHSPAHLHSPTPPLGCSKVANCAACRKHAGVCTAW